MPKGRTVPEATPNYTVPRSSSLPVGTIILRDGRTLRSVGAFDPTKAPTLVRGADGKLVSGREILGKNAKVSNRLISFWVSDDDFRVSASLSDTKFGTFLHVSCSYPDRNPTWEEIKLVRYAFYPESASVAMVLPPLSAYVNTHEYTFQMYELPVDWSRATERGTPIDADGRPLRRRRLR
jgi:hypothetical protein